MDTPQSTTTSPEERLPHWLMISFATCPTPGGLGEVAWADEINSKVVQNALARPKQQQAHPLQNAGSGVCQAGTVQPVCVVCAEGPRPHRESSPVHRLRCTARARSSHR